MMLRGGTAESRTTESANAKSEAVDFGPFRLFVVERRLEKSGAPVRIGSRAMDLLIALVERGGEVVTKRELMDRVWPDLAVDEAGLRVHIAGLRKVFNAEPDGQHYISNIQGRGYCFVASVMPVRNDRVRPPHFGLKRDISLPARLERLAGRQEVIEAITQKLSQSRFVTIVGPGGIGKTTVAVSIAYNYAEDFEGAIRFVDLSTISEPRLIPHVIAAAVGIIAQSEDIMPVLLNYLRSNRHLLVLDNCEHLIDGVAPLAERIFTETHDTHLLATSREALRAIGERIFFLHPLEVPPDPAGLSAVQALSFAAVQLFMERAVESGYDIALNDDDAPVVGEICRKLDGIALALELAAGRVATHGLRQTAALLDDRFRLTWQGRRTAMPRQRTLKATLDWSYDLLAEEEKELLRRLSVFVGVFRLEAVRAVANDAGSFDTADLLNSLVMKSLVVATIENGTAEYRLLDATRAYATQQLRDSGAFDDASRRHAIFCRDMLARAAGGEARYFLGNIRSALRWAFSETAEVQTGVALAAVSVRPLLDMSLLDEARHWAEVAIDRLDASSLGTDQELELQAALGLSLMFVKGMNQRALAALMRALELADQLGKVAEQLRLLGRLHIFHERAGGFQLASSFAHDGESVALAFADSEGVAASQSLLGISYHLHGDNVAARRALEAALKQHPTSSLINDFHFGFHHRNRARIALARTLWLQGESDQALAMADETLLEAMALRHPLTMCIAKIWALTIFHWLGDMDRAAATAREFGRLADRYSLGPYVAAAVGMQGRIAVQTGEPRQGVELLRRSLDLLRADRYELLTTEFSIALASGLAADGRLGEARSLLDETVELVLHNGDLLHLPDLIRLRADVEVSLGDAQAAETDYAHSLALARQQSSIAWQLRASVGLAQLHHNQGRRDEGRSILGSVVSELVEGFATPDVLRAQRLLETWGA